MRAADQADARAVCWREGQLVEDARGLGGSVAEVGGWGGMIHGATTAWA